MTGERVKKRQDRDPTTERMEREAFVLLLHVDSVSSGDPTVEVSDLSLGRDLAFERSHLSLLLDHLAAGGFVRCVPNGGVSVTPRGVDYLREQARLRRSIRYAAAQRGAPGIGKWGDGWRGRDPGGG
jgi:hypothetical protein